MPVTPKQQQQQIIGVRDILTIVFKHKVKILASFVVVLAVTAYLARNTPVVYVAKSIIMIKPGRESIPMGDIISDMRVPTVSQDTLLNTEMEIIMSNDLVGKAVESVGLYNLYPEMKRSGAPPARLLDTAVYLFKQDLMVKDVKGSSIIEILVRNKNPLMAQKSANAVVDCLKDKHVQVYGTPSSTFLEDQLKTYRAKIEDTESKIALYKRDHNIVSMKDQYWWMFGKRTDLESQLRIEESKLRELQDKTAFLKNQKRKVVSDLYTSSTRTSLTNLQQKEVDLLANYKENSRAVIAIRNQIKAMKETLDKYEEDNKQSNEWVLIEAELGPQQIKIDNIKRHLVSVDKSLAMLSEADREYVRMEREIESLQKNYDSFLKKYEEMKIAEDMDRRKITNLNVIERAALPVSPEKVNQQKIIGMGLFVAVALGFGWAFLAEYLPQGMTTPQSAERYLRLPVLVAVSRKE
jgi:polysaccharide biosynthesis protein PslE